MIEGETKHPFSEDELKKNEEVEIVDWKPAFWHPWRERNVSREELSYSPPQLAVVGAIFFPSYTEPSERNRGQDEDPDNVRGDLVKESLVKLAVHDNANVYITDGGSSPELLKNLCKGWAHYSQSESGAYHSLPGYGERVFAHSDGSVGTTRKSSNDREVTEFGYVDLSPQIEMGYSTGRVEAIRACLADWRSWDVLIQMELEKVNLVDQLPKLNKPILMNKADVTIPDRGIRCVDAGDDHDDFRGYPPEQAISERRQNLIIHKEFVEAGIRRVSEPVLDLLGGTRAIAPNPSLVKIFGETCMVPETSKWSGCVKPEVYLNAVYSPVYISMAAGYRVKSVPIDYVHPKSQTQIEVGNPKFVEKRASQFRDIVNGSTMLIKYLGSKKGLIKKRKNFDVDKYLSWVKSQNPDDENFRWTGKKNKISEPYYESSFSYNIRPGGYHPFEDKITERRVWKSKFLPKKYQEK